MTKFNSGASIGGIVQKTPTLTTNYEGAVAFRPSAKTDLYLRTVTWLVGEPKFYGDASTETDTIRKLIAEVAEGDPEFILKLASYCRNEMYLRSCPIFMLVEAMSIEKCKPYIKKYTPQIIKRADELTEAVALFIARNGQIGKSGAASLPSSFKKGLADTFHTFNEYNFAKYKKDDSEVKLSDVLRLVHPKPQNEDEASLFGRIRTNTLAVPETWETVISKEGNNTEAWNSVIPKMGYMAKLRNLRNIANAKADLDATLRHLTAPKAVENSKQFPYRFYSAYKMMEGVSDPFDATKIRGALETAIALSVKNIPGFTGRTLVSVDSSASMDSPVSKNSKINMVEIGAVMGAIAKSLNPTSIASVFGSDFAAYNPSPNASIMTMVGDMLRAEVGHATNGYLVFDFLTKQKLSVDRVLIFSDMQMWDTSGYNNSLYQSYLRYKTAVNPNVKLYCFDLSGYGTLQIPEGHKNVVAIGGWSDKIFTFIDKFESDPNTTLNTIEAYNPFKVSDSEEDEE